MDAWGTSAIYSTTVVPVRLGNLSVLSKEQSILLNWKVFEETGVVRYDIEHSSNEFVFKRIGTLIPANLLRDISYAYEDFNFTKGSNFYRIKMMKTTGEVFYTNIVSSFGKSLSTVSLVPNPVSDALHLEITVSEDEMIAYKIIDNNGRKISDGSRTMHAGRNDIKIEVASLSPGQYFLVYHFVDKIKRTLPFIKK